MLIVKGHSYFKPHNPIRLIIGHQIVFLPYSKYKVILVSYKFY